MQVLSFVGLLERSALNLSKETRERKTTNTFIVCKKLHSDEKHNILHPPPHQYINNIVPDVFMQLPAQYDTLIEFEVTTLFIMLLKFK